jgi:Fe-S cluster assembly iron-binding protein IscA
MLAVTDRASAAICEILGPPNMESGAGLRISSDPAVGSVQLSVSAGPLEGDAVVESNGARVFIEPRIVPILDDKALDVEPDGTGDMQFSLGPK